MKEAGMDRSNGLRSEEFGGERNISARSSRTPVARQRKTAEGGTLGDDERIGRGRSVYKKRGGTIPSQRSPEVNVPGDVDRSESGMFRHFLEVWSAVLT